ncbi:MAG: hypothetical protein ABIO70_36970 [Pseudomonadota bacterium]
MRFFLALALLGSLLTATAYAEGTTTFPNNPYYSKGAVEGFRWLYVDPDPFVQSLAPVAPLESAEAQGATASADLRIKNDTLGWIKVEVNGTEIGILTPTVDGVLHDVKPGQYDVTIEMANKLRTTYRISTIPAASPAPAK